MLEMCIYELLETKLGRDRTTLRTTRDAAAVATFAYNLRGESPRSIVLLNNLMLWQVQSSTNRLEDHILIAYSHHQNKSWKYEIQPVTNPTTIPAQILTNIALLWAENAKLLPVRNMKARKWEIQLENLPPAKVAFWWRIEMECKRQDKWVNKRRAWACGYLWCSETQWAPYWPFSSTIGCAGGPRRKIPRL